MLWSSSRRFNVEDIAERKGKESVDILLSGTAEAKPERWAWELIGCAQRRPHRNNAMSIATVQVTPW